MRIYTKHEMPRKCHFHCWGLFLRLALPAGDPACLPSAVPCPISRSRLVRGERGPSAGPSLTFAALTTAQQQVRPKTTSPRCPMVCSSLYVALPSGPRVFMGLELAGSPSWQLPTDSSLLQPLPLPPGWPHSRQCTWGQETAAVSTSLRLGQGHTAGHTCAHTHTHAHGAGTGCLSQGWLPPMPWCRSAPVRVTAYLGAKADGTGQKVAGLSLACLGEQCPAFWLTDLQGLGSALREMGMLGLHGPPASSTEGACRALGM